MSKEIDCFETNTCLESRLEPYQIIKDNNTVYIRFFNKSPCSIIRIVKDGNTYTQTWAYGNWNDYATLSYDKTINEKRWIEG